jgi:zinc transporter ZupT
MTAIAILAAVCGVALESVRGWSRRMLPFGGGVLIGVALVWILPEIAERFGWFAALGWTLSGIAAVALIDRFVYPVCPACSSDHEHSVCALRLHGFAAPLLIAAGLHAALDGWTAAAANSAPLFTRAFVIALAFHKLPEGLALGVIARAAMNSRMTAIAWCALAESMTLAGGGIQVAIAPHLNAYGVYVVLAFACGCFLYLGGHAIHGESRRSGAAPAFWPALTGMAGSSVLRLFVS